MSTHLPPTQEYPQDLELEEEGTPGAITLLSSEKVLAA
jgi:hypothetical protein